MAADISLLFGVLGEGSLSGDSGKLIQSQLTQIMAELNKNPLKVKVGIDTNAGGKKSWSSQLQEKLDKVSASGKFSAQISTLKLSPGAVSDFKKQLTAIVNTVGLSTGTQITITAEGIGDIKGKLKEAQDAIKKTGDSATEASNKLAEFKVQMEALNGQKNAVKKSLDNLGQNATTEAEKTQIAEISAQYEQWAIKIEEVRAAKSAIPADQRAAIEAEGAAILTNIERLNAERIAREEAARTAEDTANRKADAERKEAASQEQRNAALRAGITLLTQMEKAERDWTAAQTGSSKQNYAGLQSDIASLKEYKRQLEAGEITVEEFRRKLGELQASFSANSNAIKAAGENMRTLSARLGNLAQKFSAWLSVSQVIMLGIRSIRRMVSATIELDDAMTQLKIVTRDTSQAYDEYLGKITQTATKIGSAVPDLIDSTTTFARLGYTLEESSALAEFTAMLQNVGDIDVSDAQDAITAIVKAFGVSVDEVESIMDKLVITGNNFPISVSQIAEGMNNASSALAAAGNTFEQSVALLTAANTTIQNAAKSSTGLRTIAARLRSTKTELDELGETMTEAEYGTLVAALTKYNVALTDINGEFRSTYDIVADIAAIWNDLSTMEQAALANAIAGVRQQSVFFSMVEQFQEASGAMEDMAHSAGTLQESYATFMESTTAHINQFKAAFQSLSQSTFSTDFLNGIIDLGTNILKILEAISRIINVIGGLNTVLYVTAGIIATIKADALLATLLKLVAPIKAIIVSLQAARTAGVTTGQFISNAFNQIAASASAAQIAVGAFFAVFGVMTLIKNSIEDARQKAIELAEATIQETNAELERIDALKESYSIYKQYADQENLTIAEENALKSAIESITTAMDGKNSALATLTAGTEEYTKALEAQIAKELEAQEIAAKERRHAAQEKLEELSWSGWDGSQITIKVSDTSKKETEAYKLVQEIMGDFIDEGRYYGGRGGGAMELEIEPINWDSEQDVDAIVDYYYKLIELKDALVKADLMDTDDVYDIYGSVKDVIGDIGPAVEEYVKAEYDSIFAAYEKMNGVVDTAEEFVALREYLNEQLGKKFSFDGLSDTVDGFLVNENGLFGEFLNNTTNAASEVEDAVETYKASLSDLSETITNLQSAYTLLSTAQKEMASGDGLSAGTIKSLSEASENYLDYLYEENGVVKLNTEAWKENADAKMLSEMADIQKEIDSLMEQNAVLQENIDLYNERAYDTDNIAEMDYYFRKVNDATAELRENTAAIEANQNKLDLYNALYGNITGNLDAYSAALANFTNVANSVDAISNSFQTLADLQAEVANGFTMSLDKALEFAAVYPEILNNAQVSADGQILLNEDVVNSFLQGKKAELDAQIDAQIAQLEGDKAVLEAKVEAAQAQLDLAKSIGEGEGQITKELAEYRINAGNAVAQALIDAGVDEATAFKLAAAAMAQNAEEFDRVAMEVCTDVNGNFNQAAYDLAQTMYNNLTNVKTDLASVARQAHETAKAIAGIADGSVSGSSAVQGGSGGGTGSSGIKLNLTSGSFEGTEYTYTAKESNLEDFISQIELDISSYQDAISQIDGQIAVLQALKNKPLKSFASDRSGSGSSGSGTDKTNTEKEVEEYIASIDDYREALERLRLAQKATADVQREIDQAPDMRIVTQSDVELLRAENNRLNERNELLEDALGAIEYYNEVQEDLATKNIDTGKTVFGNIDLNNRQVLEWTEGAISVYQKAIDSWGESAEDLLGSISTVFGTWDEFDGVPIAFSPMLQTENGAVYLDADTVYEYIWGLIEKAGEGWHSEDLLRLDTEGLEFDGVTIKNLLADIGDTAEKTAESMHFLGTDGAINASYREISDAADALGISVEELIQQYDVFNAEIDQNDTLLEKNAVSLKAAEAAATSRFDVLRREIFLQQQLINTYVEQQAALDNLNRLKDTTISTGAQALRDLGFAVTYNAETDDLWISNLEHLNELTADSKGEYDTLQEATNALRKETEDLINTITKLNDENRESSETWLELKDSIKEAKKEVISLLGEIVTTASDAVDEIQNVYDTLKAAADEFADNGGFISVDAFQSIIALGPQYMQYLRDENGLLVINEESINRVIEAKVRQLAAEQALTYVERIRLALQEDSIENLNTLLFATTDATNATFGLAYAELELMHNMGDLNDSQYAAALHNIQAIEDLANTTVAGIGKVSGEYSENLKKELENMKSGLTDIVKYVMDMLKHRIQQQIDALEDLKDAYADIIKLRKEALDAAKKEAEYEDKVADKVKQIAKLQEKINALSLDDSRDAQAQKIKLEEELAELQKELADDQSDYAVDAQKEALDDMQTAYENEKDAEIKALEETISSYQKLYDMAIAYIESHWNTLYDELIAWNTEYGSVLNSEITEAWNNCLAAAQRYGSYVAALNSIDADIAAQTSGGGTSGTGGGTNNTVVGTTGNHSTSTKEDAIHAIIKEMYSNSQEHHTATQERKNWLSNRNLQLGTMLAQYGIHTHRENDGAWYMDGSKEFLYDKYKKYIYHKGGIAGDEPTLKQNEVMAILEKGEAVLDKRREEGLYRLVEFATTLSDKFAELMKSTDMRQTLAGTGGLTDAKADIPANISDNHEVRIEFGDTYITGTNDETVEKHRAITRQQANELLDQLNIKR